MLVGVVSDTHGLLRSEALAALQGVDHILHAGDVGDISILHRLQQIAPVTAIRGNIDVQGACSELPATEAIELGGHLFYIVHAEEALDINPEAAQIDVIVSGHSHRPSINRRGEIWYLNPGSAGPRRFSLPVTLAFVEIGPDPLQMRIVELPI